MTWDDFFGCDWNEYAQRISGYTTERLVKQEVVKTRQQMAASISIGSGLGGAVFTMGGTLAISAYGARRMRVAKKKCELIQQELIKRNIKLHEFDYKDALIPGIAGLVGMGVGFGLTDIANEATNAATMNVITPSGSSAIQAVAANPGDAIQGLGAGFTEQVREMALAVNGMGAGIMPGSDLSGEVLAAHTSWVALPSPASSVGVYAGMMMAQGVEKGIASLISAQCAWSIMEALSSLERPSVELQCSRVLGMPVTCDHCKMRMTSGTYWRGFHAGGAVVEVY